MDVRDGMTEVVVTIGPGHTLREAAAAMVGRRVGAAVVLDPEAPGPGVITERDILVSVGYAVASYTNTEDPFGDVTAASRASHINHDVFATLLITPALLDAYRFVRPGSRWIPVASRTLDATMFGITFAI